MASTTPLSFARVNSTPSAFVKGRMYFIPASNQSGSIGCYNAFLSTSTNSSGFVPIGLQYGSNNYSITGNLPTNCTAYRFQAYYVVPSSVQVDVYSDSDMRLTPASYSMLTQSHYDYAFSGAYIYANNGYTTNGNPRAYIENSVWTQDELYKAKYGLSSGNSSTTTYAELEYNQDSDMILSRFRVGHDENASDGYYNRFEFYTTNEYQSNYGTKMGFYANEYGEIFMGNPSDYGVASVSVLVGMAQTCFRGDTSYITMADGSKKLIQDIKVGDVVKGYDVNKKDYTDAVVLQNVKTGEERAFDCYVMDDGTTVDIFNNDGFICYVGKRKTLPHRDADGDYINVYSMKTLFSFHERKDDQRRIIKEDGNLENTTCVIHKFQADCAHRTARYTLYTSNGTFFVNGLLHGLASRSLPQYFKTHKISTPEYIDKIFDGVLLDLAQRDESLPDTHIENPDKVSDLATLNKAKATIAWAKNKLSKTDYKARKYVEGEISEEEWTAIKEQAAEWRKTVNDNEAIVEEYTEKVKKDNPAMFDTTSEEPEHIVRHAQWLKHQKTYDDNYKLFKQWADERVSYKEEQREKAIKEREQKKAEYEARKAKQKSTKKED